MTTIDYAALADRANREGFSVCVHPSCFVPVSGYFIGGVLPQEKVIITEHVTPEMIELTHFRAFQYMAGDQHFFIGVWHADGKKFVEVSEWVADRDLAIARAYRRGEQAIWDIEAGAEVWIDNHTQPVVS